MDLDRWYKVATKITGGSDLSRDIVHDVFIKLHGKIDYNDSYIFRAILNKWIDEKRKKKVLTLDHDSVTEAGAEFESLEYDLDPFEEEVIKALNEGYKPKEIATICNVSNGVIWQVIRRIKNEIKQK